MEARGAPRRVRYAARRRVKSGAGPRRGHCDAEAPLPGRVLRTGPPAATPYLTTECGGRAPREGKAPARRVAALRRLD